MRIVLSKTITSLKQRKLELSHHFSHIEHVFRPISYTADGADLCLKYYRAPRYRLRCVIIVLVERRCTGCTNKWSLLLNTTYIYKNFNVDYIVLAICSSAELRICWLFEYKTMTAKMRMRMHTHPPAGYFSFPDTWTKHLIFITLLGKQYFIMNKKYLNITRTSWRPLTVDTWENRHQNIPRYLPKLYC